MAIARLCVKVGKSGKAGPHAAYISREGRYANRLSKGEKLEATDAGNMPAWAQNPLDFWNAADAFERSNGTTYREMEIALPRELTPEQRIELVRDFVREEIGDRHAYQWAIHVPKAADKKEQPHAHLMFSERQRDGIERDPAQYFKRYNAKAPEKGGARKGYGLSAGMSLTASERKEEIKALRGRWEVKANAHLERAGVAQRIDMRSHAERGTGVEPEAKQLPSQWRGDGGTKIIEFRQARTELQAASDELRQVVPDAAAAVIDLAAERERRAESALAKQREEAELAKQQAELPRAPDVLADAQIQKEEALALLGDLREHIRRTLKPEVSEAQLRATMSEYDNALAGGQLRTILDAKAVREEVVPWLVEIRKETTAYVEETIEQARAELAANVNATNAHTESEPRFIGKDKWRSANEAMRMRVENEQITLKALQQKDWKRDPAPLEAAMVRVQVKFPELAARALAALRQIASQFVSHVQRLHTQGREQERQISRSIAPEQKQGRGPTR